MTQWTKAELEDWCRGWCRTPHTTLKAFIDAGFCSDQEPSREEMRLLPKPRDSTDSTTKAVMSDEVRQSATAPLIAAMERVAHETRRQQLPITALVHEIAQESLAKHKGAEDA